MLGLLSWQGVSMDPIMMAGKKKIKLFIKF